MYLKDSALHVQEGIPQPETVSPYLKFRKKKRWSPDKYVEGILTGNRVLLSQAITLIESTSHKDIEIAGIIIEKCLPHSGNSIRIGITGVPGVGKSTFIETFGKYLTSIGKKLCVLAVDPSSEISKGSILGDKTRMDELSIDPNAFIRPSPSGLTLGGVARKTRETIILCEAAGFDVIIIETVGVGQSETVVKSMWTSFCCLCFPAQETNYKELNVELWRWQMLSSLPKPMAITLPKLLPQKRYINLHYNYFQKTRTAG
jgi:LAO/AO transport system kinase